MKRSSWVSIIALMTITVGGCTQQPQKQQVMVIKKQEVKQPKRLDTTLENLLNTKGTFIEVRDAKKEYKMGENISFIIDTKGQEGYLYIMSIDNSDVTLLQPNQVSPLSEFRGKLSFPQDFTNGAFNIQASKNCSSCQEEKTTIYALLTKEPIPNFREKITGNQLLSFYKNSQQAQELTKGIHLNYNNNNTASNLSIGKTEFLVK
jgi:hypothetical protein